MRVNLKQFRIEKAASKDETRPILTHVFLDAVNGVMVATDGLAMAVVPVELSFDDATGLIPVEAIAIARNDQGKRDHAEISANGLVSVKLRGKRAEFERLDPEAGFPGWMQLLNRRKKPVLTFALNPKTLLQVTDALGGGAVKIEVFAPGEPARVTPLSSAGDLGARGIVGTIRLGEAA